MATQRFKEKIVDAQVLFDNVTPRLTDIPQLTADHTALGSTLAEARDLQARQESAEGQLRNLNDQRRDVAKRTADLRRRLAAGLKAALGPDSIGLLEFGIRPRPQTFTRTRLTPAQKAARAVERALAKAAALQAQEKPPAPAPAPKPATP